MDNIRANFSDQTFHNGWPYTSNTQNALVTVSNGVDGFSDQIRVILRPPNDDAGYAAAASARFETEPYQNFSDGHDVSLVMKTFPNHADDVAVVVGVVNRMGTTAGLSFRAQGGMVYATVVGTEVSDGGPPTQLMNGDAGLDIRLSKTGREIRMAVYPYGVPVTLVNTSITTDAPFNLARLRIDISENPPVSNGLFPAAVPERRVEIGTLNRGAQGAGFCPAAELQDDLRSMASSQNWARSTMNLPPLCNSDFTAGADGGWRVNFTGGTSLYNEQCGLVSSGWLDFRNEQDEGVFVEVVNPPESSAAVGTYLVVSSPGYSEQAGFWLLAGKLYAQVGNGFVPSAFGSSEGVPYNAQLHRWWRIRPVPPNDLVFETSGDPLTSGWTRFACGLKAVGFSLADVTVSLGVGYVGGATGTTPPNSVVFRHFNTYP